MFSLNGELNAVAKVTADAEMNLPSPPFSSGRQVIRK